MEFFCVLSVNGSLASYYVQKQENETFKAVLRTNTGNRDDIPAEIALGRANGHWQAQPWQDEIVPSLIHAIESNGR